MLQLASGDRTAETKRRERELIANYGSLLGPYAGVVKRTGLRFSRGFLVDAHESRHLPSVPENALLERLHLDMRRLPLDRELSSLEEIAGFDGDIALLLARAPRLRAVSYPHIREPDEHARWVGRASHSVERISLSTWGDDSTHGCFDVHNRSPLAQDVHQLHLRVSWPRAR